MPVAVIMFLLSLVVLVMFFGGASGSNSDHDNPIILNECLGNKGTEKPSNPKGPMNKLTFIALPILSMLGATAASILGVVFVALKMGEVIAWSWLVVCSPFLVAAILYVILIVALWSFILIHMYKLFSIVKKNNFLK